MNRNFEDPTNIRFRSNGSTSGEGNEKIFYNDGGTVVTNVRVSFWETTVFLHDLVGTEIKVTKKNPIANGFRNIGIIGNFFGLWVFLWAWKLAPNHGTFFEAIGGTLLYLLFPMIVYLVSVMGFHARDERFRLCAIVSKKRITIAERFNGVSLFGEVTEREKSLRRRELAELRVIQDAINDAVTAFSRR